MISFNIILPYAPNEDSRNVHYMTKLRGGQPTKGNQIPCKTRQSSLFQMTRLTLGPTKRHRSFLSGARKGMRLFFEYNSRAVKLITHLLLLPRLRMSGATLSPPTRLHGVHRKGFTFICDRKPGHSSSYKSSSICHLRKTEFPHRLRKFTNKIKQKTIQNMIEFQVSFLIIYLPVISATYFRK